MTMKMQVERSGSLVLRGFLPVSISAQGIKRMLLYFIGLLALTGGLERRIWAHTIKQLAYL